MSGRAVLAKNQDRRVRAGHPWVFSNEIERFEGDPADGDVVTVHDHRGSYLGKGYLNRKSLIAVRILTRTRDEIDREFFARRLRRALEYRSGFYPEDTALRILSSEADLVPGLIVDRYDDVLSVAVNTLGIEVQREMILDLLRDELAPAGIVLRADSPFRELEGLEREKRWWSGEPHAVTVRLDAVEYGLDPLEGQKTGFFLDHRDNRRRLDGRVQDAVVLDVFSYSGAWALSALRYGARRAILIDSSEPALDLATENAGRNGWADRIECLQDDAFRGLTVLARTEKRFGAVLLDPPALVKSKKQLREGLRGYRELNRRAMEILEPGGWLFTSSCSHAVDDDTFRRTLQQAARDAKRGFRLVEWGTQALDHPILLAAPETRYLKCAVLRAFA